MMSYLNSLLDILFPRTCAGCNNSLATGENLICTECIIQLPKTGYWNDTDNPVARIFWGRVYLYNVSAFLHFQKGGRLQNMIHNLKYKNNKEIGTFLGKIYGHELKNSPNADVDIIVPVPLHKSKFRKRGYNQSEYIARGISEVLKLPVITNAIERKIASESQTRKSRFERWENVRNIFQVIEPESFSDKHILLVDDVVTTGATLEACAMAILEVPGTKISVATLAFALN
jgi:ComF family protein